MGDQVRLRITDPCARCVMTTLAQGDLPKDPGILRTAVHHNHGHVGGYAAVVQGGITSAAITRGSASDITARKRYSFVKEAIKAEMTATDLIRARRDEILAVAHRHGAYHVRIFGSVARGEAAADSDIDILVAMEPGRSLLDVIDLGDELQELLRRKVDVLTEGGLSPYLRDRINAEAVAL